MKRMIRRVFQSAKQTGTEAVTKIQSPVSEEEARLKEHRRAVNEEELADMLEEASRAGLLLRKTPYRKGPGAPGCWIGGKPTLPAGIDWPMFQSVEGFTLPLQFFAQVNLREVPRVAGLPPLPDEGTLFFFIELVLGDLNGWQPGSSRVVFVPGDVSSVPERDIPPLPDLSPLDAVSDQIWWHSQRSGAEHPEMPRRLYRKWCFTFEPYETVERYFFNNKTFTEAAIDVERARMAQVEESTSVDRNIERHDAWSSDFAPYAMFGETRSPDRELITLLLLPPDSDTGIGFHSDWKVNFVIRADDLKAQAFEKAWVQGFHV